MRPKLKGNLYSISNSIELLPSLEFTALIKVVKKKFKISLYCDNNKTRFYDKQIPHIAIHHAFNS